MFTRHKKHQIIFEKGGFARDKTQSTQGLSTPFDWKCLKIYSSYSICSAFTISAVEKTLVEILTARYRSYFHKKIKRAYASQTGLLYPQVFYSELIDYQ